jgi:hypothetical protein
MSTRNIVSKRGTSVEFFSVKTLLSLAILFVKTF